jgi:PNKP adenylyltransferase domain, ligase domain
VLAVLLACQWPGRVATGSFHLLASEGSVHVNKDHLWYMETLARIAACDPDLLVATHYRRVEPLGYGFNTGRYQLVGGNDRERR